MLSFLAPYKYAVLAALFFALTAGGILAVRNHNAGQQRIGEDRVLAKWAASTAAAQTSQRVREAKFQKEKDDAESQAAIRITQARTAAANALASNRVLDNTVADLLADPLQLPSKPIAATPQPLEKYSVTVQRNIESWESSLKATLTTP